MDQDWKEKLLANAALATDLAWEKLRIDMSATKFGDWEEAPNREALARAIADAQREDTEPVPGSRILVDRICRACDQYRVHINQDTGEWVCRACHASGGRLPEEFDSDEVRMRRVVRKLEGELGDLKRRHGRLRLSAVALLLVAVELAVAVAVAIAWRFQ